MSKMLGIVAQMYQHFFECEKSRFFGVFLAIFAGKPCKIYAVKLSCCHDFLMISTSIIL